MFKIAVNREMTGEEFKTAANLQVFGVASVRSEWKHVKDHYGPADDPVEIGVEVSLLRRMRGAAAASKGIEVDDKGKITGADARAKDFLVQPGSDEKSALMKEIDRRYHAATGTPEGTQIKPGETANAALWNSIRGEVLFQHQYIANLPTNVKQLKRARVAAKLGEMSPEELAKAKQAWEDGIKAVDDAARELAPGADKIAELKKSLTPALPHAGDVSGPSLVMLDKLDKSVLPKLKAADGAELDRLGKMLVEDPLLAERLAKSNNPYGALKKATTVREMDNALFTGRLGELKINGARIGPAADKSGIPAAELAKLTDADIKALGEGDRLIAEARQGFGPSEADLGKLASAQAKFDEVSGVATSTRDELRAAIAHQHGLSDLPFMRNPGEALAAKFPDIPKSSMDALVKRHPDALRALENASKQEVEAVVKAFESSANPKDVEDILRSYMYKAQKKARKGVTSGLDVSDDVGGRLEESLDNLAQARKQGHPFGFKDKAQYDQFISTVDSEVASRGIKGKAKVQGSAMHSKNPGDIDMEIVVDQAEFDRLSKEFLSSAPNKKARDALSVSIRKNKIPSYEFYPRHDPSIATAAKKFTQGTSGGPLEVQATLIVRGSDFDLGPFL